MQNSWFSVKFELGNPEYYSLNNLFGTSYELCKQKKSEIKYKVIFNKF
jgi:hypothetical protein